MQVVHEPIALVAGTDLDGLEDEGVWDGDALVGRHENPDVLLLVLLEAAPAGELPEVVPRRAAHVPEAHAVLVGHIVRDANPLGMLGQGPDCVVVRGDALLVDELVGTVPHEAPELAGGNGCAAVLDQMVGGRVLLVLRNPYVPVISKELVHLVPEALEGVEHVWGPRGAGKVARGIDARPEVPGKLAEALGADLGLSGDAATIVVHVAADVLRADRGLCEGGDHEALVAVLGTVETVFCHLGERALEERSAVRALRDAPVHALALVLREDPRKHLAAADYARGTVVVGLEGVTLLLGDALRHDRDAEVHDVRIRRGAPPIEALEKVGSQLVVTIEKQRVLSRSLGDAMLANEMESLVLGMANHDEPVIVLGLSLDDGEGAVRAAVVHNDGLEVIQALILETPDATAGVPLDVVRRDHHRKLWHMHTPDDFDG